MLKAGRAQLRAVAHAVVTRNESLILTLEPHAELHTRRLLAGHRDIRVTSARRTPELNRAVGGVARSKHLEGRAVDLAGPGGSLRHLARQLRASRFTHLYGHPTEVIDEGDHLHVAW